MSWRAESQFVSQGKEQEKEFMKLVKKAREIAKLETQAAPIEANQKAKIATKPEVLSDLVKADISKCPDDIWEKHADVFDMLSIEQQEQVMKKKEKAKVAKEKEAADSRKRVEAATRPPVQEERVYKPPRENVKRHERPVTDLYFDESTGYLYSASKDKFVIRWDISTGFLESIATLARHEGSVWCVDGDATGIVSGGADGMLVFWDKNHSREVQTSRNTQTFPGILKTLRVSEHGIILFGDKMGGSNVPYLTYLSRDGKTTLWKTEDFGPKISQVLWTPVGKPKMFTSHEDGTIRCWAKDGVADENGGSTPVPKLLTTLKPHDQAIFSMNKTSRYLLTASADNTVKAIDVSTPAMKVAYQAKQNRPLRCVAGYDWPEEKCFGFFYAGGRDPRDVALRKPLEDEFEVFINYFGEYKHQAVSWRAHISPIHKVLWSTERGMMFSGAEDGDVKMFMETREGGLINPTPWNT